MVILGIDTHKKSHTVVATDECGRQLGTKTFGTTTTEHMRLVEWAQSFGQQRRFAVEDCRSLSRRLERDLLQAGEHLVRVSPKMMANIRNQARTYGKSDPIDALAVARAALREPDLPVARLEGKEREIRLLTDHRQDLVQERTRLINRLRWHIHELDPTWVIPLHHFTTSTTALKVVLDRLLNIDGVVARIARDLVERCVALTKSIQSLGSELDALVKLVAPSLLVIPGCGSITAAKIIAETADISRFRDKNAYARHNGTAPIPVWSSNTQRFRLSRTGNRQLNAAIHRIAITQSRCYEEAQVYIAKRISMGNSKRESIRLLKRHLSNVVFAALMRDINLDTQGLETPMKIYSIVG